MTGFTNMALAAGAGLAVVLVAGAPDAALAQGYESSDFPGGEFSGDGYEPQQPNAYYYGNGYQPYYAPGYAPNTAPYYAPYGAPYYGPAYDPYYHSRDYDNRARSRSYYNRHSRSTREEYDTQKVYPNAPSDPDGIPNHRQLDRGGRRVIDGVPNYRQPGKNGGGVVDGE